jgi:hypothetical protein
LPAKIEDFPREISGFLRVKITPFFSFKISIVRYYLEMPCQDCEKKQSKGLITPDRWKVGAKNTITGSQGRKLNENKLLTKHNPVTDNKCITCKKQLNTRGKYCQQCSYKKGLCSLCGKKILDTQMYRQTTK